MAAAGQNTILYIGLNPGGAAEAQGLRGFGARVLYIGNSSKPDHVFIKGKSHDLANEEGRMALASALKLTEYQRQIVTSVVCSSTRRRFARSSKRPTPNRYRQDSRPSVCRSRISRPSTGSKR